MNFLEEKTLEMDGLDPKICAQIATILRHQVRQTLTNDLNFTKESVRTEAREMTKETVNKYMGTNMEVIIQNSVRTYLTEKVNVKKMIEDEIKAQISIIVSQNLKISLNKD